VEMLVNGGVDEDMEESISARVSWSGLLSGSEVLA
jgi:hypothetical protein